MQSMEQQNYIPISLYLLVNALYVVYCFIYFCCIGAHRKTASLAIWVPATIVCC